MSSPNLRRKLLSDIQLESGFAYKVSTGQPRLSSHKGPSTARILEDGVPLTGPENAPHKDIREIGLGRYSFWHDYVYFSASDNSDPRINGRSYQIEYPKKLNQQSPFLIQFIAKIINRGKKRLKQQIEGTPVNLAPRDHSMENIKSDVEYALRIGTEYINRLPEKDKSLSGRTILEIGPGINYGSALLLACMGAKAFVADRFLAPWDDEYHPKFYALLSEAIDRNMPKADLTPLRKIIKDNEYSEEYIRCFSTPMEKLEGIPDESVDIVFSNAVLEHIADPKQAFEQMARVSKPGALGYHQVDFRDHRNMDKPLEFLLMSNEEFEREFEMRHGECGNRYRPWEYKKLFESLGFDVVSFEPNIYADDDYLNQFIPRLQACEKSRYRNVEKRILREISGLYSVIKDI